jgi:hypothetical protein
MLASAETEPWVVRSRPGIVAFGTSPGRTVLDEMAETLDTPAGISLPDYRASLMRRFGNSARSRCSTSSRTQMHDAAGAAPTSGNHRDAAPGR